MKAYPDCNGDRVKTCPDCNGDGVVDKDTDDERQCPTCGGLGFVPDDDKDHEEVIKTQAGASSVRATANKRQRKIKTCRVECDGEDIFIVADGLQIAKRGHPGTPQAKTWVSLEPGWTVRDCGEGDSIEIEYKRQRMH